MNWDLCWTDSAITPDRLSTMKLHQKINHFPGMYAIARKNTMATHLNKLRKLFPTDYGFYPKTWMLPTDLYEFKQETRGTKRTFIVKPEASSQGKGIYLVNRPEDIENTEHSIAQEYISSPLLIDGFKFDLRLYVLVTGCAPMRVFLHEEGLVRLATERYCHPNKFNMKKVCMHLTNYAVNKASPNFMNNENVSSYSGSKRSLSSFLLNLESYGHDVQLLWDKLCDLVIKTLITVQPSLVHTYNSCQPNDLFNGMCFEVLGFDVMIDEQLKPHLLEVNHSPSFNTDSQLDYEIKSRVISEALRLVNITPEQRKHGDKLQKNLFRMRMTGTKTFKETKVLLAQKKGKLSMQRDQYEEEVDTGYIKIYPSNEYYYSQFVQAAKKAWENFTGPPRATIHVTRHKSKRRTQSKIQFNTQEGSPESSSSNKTFDVEINKTSKINNQISSKTIIEDKHRRKVDLSPYRTPLVKTVKKHQVNIQVPKKWLAFKYKK